MIKEEQNGIAEDGGRSRRVLFINSTPKAKADSITLQLADAFLEAYREANPGDEITTLNLYEEDIRFLDMNDLNQLLGADPGQVNFIRYTTQFAEADKYVIAAPMWNLTVPAILSAYLDYANVKGVTFYYTEDSAVGMLKDMGKKAAFISSRGGAYTAGDWEPFEMAERYVRKQFEFLGIAEFELVLMELADVLRGPALEDAKVASLARAREMGRRF